MTTKQLYERLAQLGAPQALLPLRRAVEVLAAFYDVATGPIVRAVADAVAGEGGALSIYGIKPPDESAFWSWPRGRTLSDLASYRARAICTQAAHLVAE